MQVFFPSFPFVSFYFLITLFVLSFLFIISWLIFFILSFRALLVLTQFSLASSLRIQIPESRRSFDETVGPQWCFSTERGHLKSAWCSDRLWAGTQCVLAESGRSLLIYNQMWNKCVQVRNSHGGKDDFSNDLESHQAPGRKWGHIQLVNLKWV